MDKTNGLEFKNFRHFSSLKLTLVTSFYFRHSIHVSSLATIAEFRIEVFGKCEIWDRGMCDGRYKIQYAECGKLRWKR